MSFSANKVFLLGNLGRDAEVRYTGKGTAVANLTVATEEGWGENKRTEWHTVVAWDKLAELCGKLAKKGDKIHIEGSLQTRKYQGKDGGDRYRTEVVAREVVFLPSGASGRPSGPPPGRPDRAVPVEADLEDVPF